MNPGRARIDVWGIVVAAVFVVSACSAGTTVAPSTSAVPLEVLPSGPVSVPECGAYWGAYINPKLRGGGFAAQNRLIAIREAEADIARTFDIDRQFYRWDTFLSDQNVDEYVSQSLDDGRLLFLSWKPVMEDGTNIAWNAIAEGAHDDLIRRKAKTVLSLDVPVLLAFDHEANARVGEFAQGKSEESHVTAPAGSEADFVAAWRHLRAIFAEEAVSNVSWAWVMSRDPFEDGGKQADLLYPGDEHVDWVGVDPYNFFWNNKWREMDDLMVGFSSWVNRTGIQKPWVIAEWGSVEDPEVVGRKAEWLGNAADYFESESRIRAVVHFDSAPDFDWRYDTSSESRTAFAAISGRDHFEQVC